MEKLAKIFGHDFRDGDFELFDKNGNLVYFEYSDGYWIKREYDKNNNQIYYEDSTGFWSKSEYDNSRNEIYFENSIGEIIDDRPKTCIDKEIIIDGKKYQLVEMEE